MLRLSSVGELNLRLRWVALLCGASIVQVVSALLAHGVDRLRQLVVELEAWLEEHDWQAVRSLVGCMSHQHDPDPRQLERANYARLLQSWTKE